MLIVGYSFGDKYINHAFFRMSQIHGSKARVVIIDKWPLTKYYEIDEIVKEYKDNADE